MHSIIAFSKSLPILCPKTLNLFKLAKKYLVHISFHKIYENRSRANEILNMEI